MKRFVSIILMLAMVFALCACGSQSAAPAAAEAGSSSSKEILYHVFSSTPYVTLDPRVEVSNGVMTLNNIYETLTHFNDKTGEVEGVLATDWSSNEEGTEWIFNLRNDVTFHDGSKMTAANVVNSINKVIEMGQGAAYIWDAVESIEAVSDYQVKFTCSYACPIDIVASAAYAAFIVSDAALEQTTEWFNEGNDGGTGPYVLASVTPDAVALVAYDNYRGGWADNQYKNVVIREVPESSARRQMLETGEAQITSELSSTDLNAMKERTDIVDVELFNTYTNIMLLLNHEAAPTDNVYFRQALCWAFPYEDTIESVLEGNGTLPHGIVPPGLWGHSEEIPQFTCDLDKAQECLDKSGIDTNGLQIELTYMTGDEAYASWAQLYQINLKKLGIDLVLSPMEWDAQWELAKAENPEARQHIFVFQWWPDYPSPDSWFTSLVTSSEDEIYYNLSYINDEEYDALIDEAVLNGASNRELAEKNYIELQKKLVENADILVAYDLAKVYVYSNQIQGVYENPAYATVCNYYNVTKK